MLTLLLMPLAGLYFCVGLYAVKRLKKRICSESEGVLVVREACAHAALEGDDDDFDFTTK
jgi:hypothetical protein